MAVQSDDKKSNKKRAGLVVGLVALVVAAAAIGAGTYAAFSDTETGPTGTVGAGTLDLTVGSTGATELFAAANIVPGYTQDVTITLNNVGTTPGTLTSTMSATGADGACTEPEQVAEGSTACAPGGNLQDQMTVQVLSSPTSSTAGAVQSVSSFITAGGLGAGGTLQGGGSGTYKLRFALPNLSGTQNNIVQGDSIKVDSTFNLLQA